MEIKPMFDNTIKMNVTQIKLDEVKVAPVVKQDTIPNGILKVIKWEVARQLFTIGLNSLLILGSIILAVLYATDVFNVSWIAYSIPITVFILSSWKLLTTLIERSRLLKDVQRYREDLKVGLNSTPPFISRMYMNLYSKQVAHNWLTITILFYGGISTMLLWWLKDVSWWIFDFRSWISDIFSNPTLMAWMFTILLIAVAVIHIIFAVQRNKRILEINSFFGKEIATASDVEAMKTARNKTYRRLFIISIMIVLIIPILVRFALKMFKKK